MTDNKTYDKLSSILGKNAAKQDTEIWLDTGIPELNKAISGSHTKGVPVGRLIEIYGPASSGKTFVSTMIMKACQAAGGIAGFSDHERSFKAEFASRLGLNVDESKGNWVYKRPQTFEESIDIAIAFCEFVRREKLIPDEAPLVWVFDSVASMVPHSKLYDDKGKRREVGSYTMRDSLLLAKSTSQSYPMLAQFAEDNNMLVVLLNQTRLKPGVMYGDPLTTPGGQAAEFYCSVRIALGKTMLTEGKGDEKRTIGVEVGVKCVKNKVSRPFETAAYRVLYDEEGGANVDEVGTLLDYVIRIGLVEKDDKRIVWEGAKKYASVVATELRADPDGVSKLLALIK